jgi:pimeloyl-ACP methyl ester carboxylesterase
VNSHPLDEMAKDTVTIRAGNVMLVAQTAGSATNPPVVFLHGGGQTRGSWKRSLDVVAARGFFALAYDTRGHGDSDWSPDGDYDLATLADDLRAVLATLDRPAALVGASMGGLTALTYVGGERSGIARALALIDVAPQVNATGAERILDFMSAHPDGFGSIENAAAAIARYLPHRPKPTSHNGLRRNLRQRGDRLFWHWDPRLLDARNTDGARAAPSLEAAARAVRIPTMLVRAENSDVVTDEEVAHLREVIPHSEYVSVPGTSHMVAGDANDVFNGAILDFLERTRALGMEKAT